MKSARRTVMLRRETCQNGRLKNAVQVFTPLSFRYEIVDTAKQEQHALRPNTVGRNVMIGGSTKAYMQVAGMLGKDYLAMHAYLFVLLRSPLHSCCLPAVYFLQLNYVLLSLFRFLIKILQKNGLGSKFFLVACIGVRTV